MNSCAPGFQCLHDPRRSPAFIGAYTTFLRQDLASEDATSANDIYMSLDPGQRLVFVSRWYLEQ